jgi:protein SCO1/2
MTDKQIQLNQLIFHGKKILPIRLACLSFQLLIHIYMSAGIMLLLKGSRLRVSFLLISGLCSPVCQPVYFIGQSLSMSCRFKDSVKIFAYQTSIFLLAILLSATSLACQNSSNSSNAQHFDIKGKVVTVDKEKKEITLDHEEIEGFMDAMTMPFIVKDRDALDVMSTGDTIQATLVVSDDRSWIENPVITKGDASSSALNSITDSTEPRVGSEVPDFSLINQDGKSIKLHEYRDRALLITFIYTRCPLPDYCTLMSTNFAEINHELQKNTSLKTSTHLLSITIDPSYDTPKVLKSYGSAHTGKYNEERFDYWEFATGTPEEIKRIADFFGLTYRSEKDQIVHSLRTALIAPDGRIYKIYRGNEWKPTQLLRDLQSLLNNMKGHSTQ